MCSGARMRICVRVGDPREIGARRRRDDARRDSGTIVAGATVARPRGRPARHHERSAAAAVAVSTAMSLSIRTYNGIRARCGATLAVATNDDGHGGGSDEPLARRTRNTHRRARPPPPLFRKTISSYLPPPLPIPFPPPSKPKRGAVGCCLWIRIR